MGTAGATEWTDATPKFVPDRGQSHQQTLRRTVRSQQGRCENRYLGYGQQMRVIKGLLRANPPIPIVKRVCHRLV